MKKPHHLLLVFPSAASRNDFLQHELPPEAESLYIFNRCSYGKAPLSSRCHWYHPLFNPIDFRYYYRSLREEFPETDVQIFASPLLRFYLRFLLHL